MDPVQPCESDQHMHNPVELREAKRYRLTAPAIFLWAPQHRKPQNGKSVIRDSVYVLSDSLPPAGARVQMEHLQGEGVVLRGEPSGSEDAGSSQGGFAASAQFYPQSMATVFSYLETSGQIV